MHFYFSEDRAQWKTVFKNQFMNQKNCLEITQEFSLIFAHHAWLAAIFFEGGDLICSFHWLIDWLNDWWLIDWLTSWASIGSMPGQWLSRWLNIVPTLANWMLFSLYNVPRLAKCIKHWQDPLELTASVHSIHPYLKCTLRLTLEVLTTLNDMIIHLKSVLVTVTHNVKKMKIT